MPLGSRKLSRRQLLAMTHASLPSPPKCPVTLPYYGQSPDVQDISELEDTDSGGCGIRFNDNSVNSAEHSRSQSGSDSAACLQSPEDISRPPSEAVESSMSELTHDSATEAEDSEACDELNSRRRSSSKRRASCQISDGGRRKRFQHRAALSVEGLVSATERTDSCASAREQLPSWLNEEPGKDNC
ncbi:hypothetical protein AAHC03_05037 [Spirometra sp. Aus1]